MKFIFHSRYFFSFENLKTILFLMIMGILAPQNLWAISPPNLDRVKNFDCKNYIQSYFSKKNSWQISRKFNLLGFKAYKKKKWSKLVNFSSVL